MGGEGCFFGETPLLMEAAGRVDETWIRTRTVRATIETQLGVLRTEDVRKMWKDCPGVKVRISRFHQIGDRLGKTTTRKEKMQAAPETQEEQLQNLQSSMKEMQNNQKELQNNQKELQ